MRLPISGDKNSDRIVNAEIVSAASMAEAPITYSTNVGKKKYGARFEKLVKTFANVKHMVSRSFTADIGIMASFPLRLIANTVRAPATTAIAIIALEGALPKGT